jgi:uncharacterized membrane protein
MPAAAAPRAPNAIDVQAIALGLDHRARREVQGAMKRIAIDGDTGTKRGLVRMWGDAGGVLLAAEGSWTHGHAEGGPPRAPADAQKHFVEVAHRARSRFPVETIRASAGAVLRSPPPEVAASDEPGVVLVTVVVASKKELPDVGDATSRASLRAGLEALGAIEESDLVAMEVVWSPSEEGDRVSPAQIEARHPEIRRLTS